MRAVRRRPDLVGIHIAGILVEHIDRISEVCVQRGVTIGVIATPGAAAQAVCNQLVGAGVRSILNFAPVVLQVPQEVEVRKVDLAVEMQILSFHVARRHGEPALNGAAASGSANGTAILSTSVDAAAGGSVNGSVNSSVLRDPAVSRDGLVGRAVMP